MSKRTVYIYDNEQKKVVPVSEVRYAEPKVHVITDEMPASKHPCNGLYYTSKSAFRQTTRQHGCVELGNEQIKPKEYDRRASKQKNVEAIKRAMYETGYYKG